MYLRQLGEVFDDSGSNICKSIGGSISALLKFKDSFYNSQFSTGGRDTTESSPVVNYHTGANNIRTAVDRSSGDWDLQQLRQLVHVGYRGLGVNHSSSVTDDTVATDENVARDSSSEDLGLECVSDDLFSLAIHVGMDERNIVVGGYTVS